MALSSTPFTDGLGLKDLPLLSERPSSALEKIAQRNLRGHEVETRCKFLTDQLTDEVLNKAVAGSEGDKQKVDYLVMQLVRDESKVPLCVCCYKKLTGKSFIKSHLVSEWFLNRLDIPLAIFDAPARASARFVSSTKSMAVRFLCMRCDNTMGSWEGSLSKDSDFKTGLKDVFVKDIFQLPGQIFQVAKEQSLFRFLMPNVFRLIAYNLKRSDIDDVKWKTFDSIRTYLHSKLLGISGPKLSQDPHLYVCCRGSSAVRTIFEGIEFGSRPDVFRNRFESLWAELKSSGYSHTYSVEELNQTLKRRVRKRRVFDDLIVVSLEKRNCVVLSFFALIVVCSPTHIPGLSQFEVRDVQSSKRLSDQEFQDSSLAAGYIRNAYILAALNERVQPSKPYLRDERERREYKEKTRITSESCGPIYGFASLFHYLDEKGSEEVQKNLHEIFEESEGGKKLRRCFLDFVPGRFYWEDAEEDVRSFCCAAGFEEAYGKVRDLRFLGRDDVRMILQRIYDLGVLQLRC
mmetsp:Transcript_10896/g.17840  ORF Transcript_10896/g.17840 Transcript_10896/m.17840 type:complete len:517 (-) Transcript_10896:376-1926(-)|eukprot:CAMPEP_0184657784 /NCGR_PEP_ID=MMETSP0308-20130426/21771_1 /TAXON_ID=38269 /ORGANISM="Gloeochaete witrockiana, Strain SAG 46.84" /LENGTH=516 /DNA_ID=CAMNT_0027096053 /DNA_START=413 /DNA_END=1963 /DNA_ORIENTATION=-